jgi:hypothetical protein
MPQSCFSESGVIIDNGDALDVLRTLPDGSGMP